MNLLIINFGSPLAQIVQYLKISPCSATLLTYFRTLKITTNSAKSASNHWDIDSSYKNKKLNNKKMENFS